MLRKYNADTRQVIEYEKVDIQLDLSYIEQPVEILDQKEQVLRNKTVKLVRVLWRNQDVEESTRELESAMLEKYPHLFSTWFRDGILVRRGGCNNPKFSVLVKSVRMNSKNAVRKNFLAHPIYMMEIESFEAR